MGGITKTAKLILLQKGRFMKSKKIKDKKVYADEEEKVKEMLENWDIVECAICKKEISMLNAKTINGGQYFICKSGH